MKIGCPIIAGFVDLRVVLLVFRRQLKESKRKKCLEGKIFRLEIGFFSLDQIWDKHPLIMQKTAMVSSNSHLSIAIESH